VSAKLHVASVVIRNNYHGSL